MDVMMKMSTDDVRRLREKFTTNLSLEQFVTLMKTSLRDRIHSEIDFVVSAIELFHTIDVNGDRTLEWDEFAGYMLDAGQAKADFFFDDSSERKRFHRWALACRDGKTPLNRIRSVVQQLIYLPDLNAIAYFERNADVIYIYALHFDQNDAPRHVSTIRLHTAFQEHVVLSMAYIPDKRWLVVSSVRTAAYLSVWLLPDHRHSPASRSSDSAIHGASPNHEEEMPHHSHSPMMLHRVELASPQELLTWLPTMHALATASAVYPAISSAIRSVSDLEGDGRGSLRHRSQPGNGSASTTTTSCMSATASSSAATATPSVSATTKIHQLLIWDLPALTTRNGFRYRDRIKGARALVSFTTPRHRVFLVVGRDDGILVVVDAENGRELQHVDAHAHGVRVLARAPLSALLASAGAHAYADESSQHIRIWREGGDGQLTAETTLRAQDVAVVTMHFLEATTPRQLITGDVRGVFRVYTVASAPRSLGLASDEEQRWPCLQVLTTGVPRLQTSVVVPESRQSDAVMLAAGSSVAFFDLCVQRVREDVLLACFCAELNVVLAVTPARLLVWHADSGLLARSYTFASICRQSDSAPTAARDGTNVGNNIGGTVANGASHLAGLTGVRRGGGGGGGGVRTKTAASRGDETGRRTGNGTYGGGGSEEEDGYDDCENDSPAGALPLPPASITAACLDDRERKVILGDDRGRIRVVNLANGNVMKALDPHRMGAAVIWLSYVLASKRVLSVALDGVLHVHDENNPTGYYVPFGGGRPQSVLLQSLRVLPESGGDDAKLRDGHHRPPSQCARDETQSPWTKDVTATTSEPATFARFDVVRAIGDQARNLLAILMAGTRGESFIQLWNFDLSHPQGTCITPTEEEITCLSFFGASSAILGGTVAGRVFLWMPSSERGGYSCMAEFQMLPSTSTSVESPPADPLSTNATPDLQAPLPPILHVLTMPGAHVATSNDTAPSELSEPPIANSMPSVTFLTAEDDPSVDAETPDTSSDEKSRLKCHPDDLIVFAGDETGHISVWHVSHESSLLRSSMIDKYAATSAGCHNDRRHRLSQSRPPVSATPSATTGGGLITNAAIAFHHEEMGMSYEALAALHSHAQELAADTATHSHWVSTVSAYTRWRAHTEGGVASLRLATPTSTDTVSGGKGVVLSAGSVLGIVKAWSVDGALLGVLDHFATRRCPTTHPWKFPLDMQERSRQRTEQAQNLLTRWRELATPGGDRRPMRLSILQERLSLTPFEMLAAASERARNHLTGPPSTRSASRDREDPNGESDSALTTARYHMLEQASTAHLLPSSTETPARVTERRRSSESMCSLHTILSELPGSGVETTGGTVSAARGRKKYTRVTMADVKNALHPRLRRSRSQSTVHCGVATSLTNPPSATSASGRHTKEIYVVSAGETPGRKDLLQKYPHDSSNAASATSNQFETSPVTSAAYARRMRATTVTKAMRETAATRLDETESSRHVEGGPAIATSDGVLNYHMRLAHTWSHFKS